MDESKIVRIGLTEKQVSALGMQKLMSKKVLNANRNKMPQEAIELAESLIKLYDTLIDAYFDD